MGAPAHSFLVRKKHYPSRETRAKARDRIDGKTARQTRFGRVFAGRDEGGLGDVVRRSAAVRRNDGGFSVVAPAPLAGALTQVVRLPPKIASECPVLGVLPAAAAIFRHSRGRLQRSFSCCSFSPARDVRVAFIDLSLVRKTSSRNWHENERLPLRSREQIFRGNAPRSTHFGGRFDASSLK
ncbi:hypothetical protein D9M72_508400 [compost metagenome]